VTGDRSDGESLDLVARAGAQAAPGGVEAPAATPKRSA
jgi:hypothetical protein